MMCRLFVRLGFFVALIILTVFALTFLSKKITTNRYILRSPYSHLYFDLPLLRSYQKFLDINIQESTTPILAEVKCMYIKQTTDISTLPDFYSPKCIIASYTTLTQAGDLQNFPSLRVDLQDIRETDTLIPLNLKLKIYPSKNQNLPAPQLTIPPTKDQLYSIFVHIFSDSPIVEVKYQRLPLTTKEWLAQNKLSEDSINILLENIKNHLEQTNLQLTSDIIECSLTGICVPADLNYLQMDHAARQKIDITEICNNNMSTLAGAFPQLSQTQIRILHNAQKDLCNVYGMPKYTQLLQIDSLAQFIEYLYQSTYLNVYKYKAPTGFKYNASSTPIIYYDKLLNEYILALLDRFETRK